MLQFEYMQVNTQNWCGNSEVAKPDVKHVNFQFFNQLLYFWVMITVWVEFRLEFARLVIFIYRLSARSSLSMSHLFTLTASV